MKGAPGLANPAPLSLFYFLISLAIVTTLSSLSIGGPIIITNYEAFLIPPSVSLTINAFSFSNTIQPSLTKALHSA